MANYYDGDDREDVIKEQSKTDPSSTDDDGSESRQEGLDRGTDDTPSKSTPH